MNEAQGLLDRAVTEEERRTSQYGDCLAMWGKFYSPPEASKQDRCFSFLRLKEPRRITIILGLAWWVADSCFYRIIEIPPTRDSPCFDSNLVIVIFLKEFRRLPGGLIDKTLNFLSRVRYFGLYGCSSFLSPSKPTVDVEKVQACVVPLAMRSWGVRSVVLLPWMLQKLAYALFIKTACGEWGNDGVNRNTEAFSWTSSHGYSTACECHSSPCLWISVVQLHSSHSLCALVFFKRIFSLSVSWRMQVHVFFWFQVRCWSVIPGTRHKFYSTSRELLC